MYQSRGNVSTWRTNVSNGVPIFWTKKNSSYEMIKEISILFKLLCKKFYIILDVIVIHIICRCIVHRNCIILHFYTSCNIKGKCGKSFFCFVFVFFWFLLISLKWKYKKIWFLYVTSNKGFFQFSTAKTTKQNKKCVWILWSSWTVICLSWRSEIVIRNIIVTMFLSISHEYVLG